MSNRSKIWDHFVRKTKETAECKKCNKSLKCCGGSTSSLNSHVKNVHGININESDSSGFKKQKTLGEYVQRKSIEEEISRLASADGLSFHCITNSKFIQESLQKTKYDKPHPTSHTGVRNLLLSFYEKKKHELIGFFKEQVSKSIRFSLTLDEYTSLQNVRYMNINVHNESQHWSLGMIKASNSLNYTRIIEIVSKRLEEFGLDFNTHIVGCTTDGASVMVKFGNEIASNHQQCIAHCIHLAVSDILYSKAAKCVNEEVTDSDIEDDDENLNEDEYDVNQGREMDPMFGINIDTNEAPQVSVDYLRVIKKVRKICRMFRKSPVKNDRLQDFVKEEFNGEEKKLILDCKTRWNSLLSMIERFLQLRNCIPKALRVLASTENVFEEEWNLLDNLAESLRPLEFVLKILCSEDATLLKADMLMKLCLKKLDNKKNSIAANLKECLIKRYSSRRQKEVISLLRYLTNPEDFKNESSDLFPLLSRQAVKKIAENTFLRLFPSECQTIEVDDNAESEVQGAASIAKTIEEEELMHEYLSEMNKLEMLPMKDSRDFIVNNEFKYFEATLKKSEHLELLHNALLTVKPTSVESERGFSAAGFFVSKLRSRMTDKTLNALCFLRCYFQNRDKV